MKFTREELAAICYKECLDAEILEDKNIFRDLPALEMLKDHGILNTCWSVYHIMIFKYRNKFYRGTYIVSAGDPPEEELNPEEIECSEVEQKEVKQEAGVKKWIWTVIK